MLQIKRILRTLISDVTNNIPSHPTLLGRGGSFSIIFSDGFTKKFAEVEVCHMSVGSLQTDRRYFIIRAERFGTRYGASVVLSLLDTPNRTLRVFVPKNFYLSFNHEDIDQINSSSVKLSLIYKGTCVNTKTFKLAIK
jgi:hypothetical protein